MASRAQLRDQALNLPSEEREKLAQELFESLEDAPPADADWERDWARELERRLEEIAAGEVELVDAADVHAELREALDNIRT